MNAPACDEKIRTVADMRLPGGEFQLLIQKLGYQALIAMGVLENPVTRSSNEDLERARAVIDDLLMLRRKTSGNLDAEEAEHLGGVIRDLEQHFQTLTVSTSI